MLEGVASDRRAKPLGATMGGGGARASGGAKASLATIPRGTEVTDLTSRPLKPDTPRVK